MAETQPRCEEMKTVSKVFIKLETNGKNHRGLHRKRWVDVARRQNR